MKKLIDESIYREARRKLDEYFSDHDSEYFISSRMPRFVRADDLLVKEPEPYARTTWFKNNPDILPCPFCGCATCFAVVENERDDQGVLMYKQCFVGCFVCKITTEKKGYDYVIREFLVKQWNKRIIDEEVS
jgi:hypothetical protein